MPAIIAPIAEWISTVAWPAILRVLGALGITKLYQIIKDYIFIKLGQGLVETALRVPILVAGLGLYAAFLLVFWNFSMLGTMRDLWNANPFQGISALAGSLYLATNFFPFHFFFGVSVAYIQWRLTLIPAALALNRAIKLLPGF